MNGLRGVMGKKKTKGASAASPVHVETIAAGDGVSFPQDGDEIVCHYVGRLAADGTVFDSSRAKGKPFTFKLGQGQVIRHFGSVSRICWWRSCVE